MNDSSVNAEYVVGFGEFREPPITIEVQSGRRIVLRQAQSYDSTKIRDSYSDAINLLIEAALDMPAFVEALRGRGAVVLQPGEEMPKE